MIHYNYYTIFYYTINTEFSKRRFGEEAKRKAGKRKRTSATPNR